MHILVGSHDDPLPDMGSNFRPMHNTQPGYLVNHQKFVVAPSDPAGCCVSTKNQADPTARCTDGAPAPTCRRGRLAQAFK